MLFLSGFPASRRQMLFFLASEVESAVVLFPSLSSDMQAGLSCPLLAPFFLSFKVTHDTLFSHTPFQANI